MVSVAGCVNTGVQVCVCVLFYLWSPRLPFGAGPVYLPSTRGWGMHEHVVVWFFGFLWLSVAGVPQMVVITTSWSAKDSAKTTRTCSIADVQELFDVVPASWFAASSKDGGGAESERLRHSVVPPPSFFVSAGNPMPSHDIAKAIQR